MTCPSCRASLAAGASRCGACGALLAIPTEGALAPDLRSRDIPGLRKPQRTWKDEVRDRVQSRRAARTTAPAAPDPVTADDTLLDQSSPEGTLLELGRERDVATDEASPYAITEKFDGPMGGPTRLDDLDLRPPAPASAPREVAVALEEPPAPAVVEPIRPRRAPAAKVVEPAAAPMPAPTPMPAPAPELRWDAPATEPKSGDVQVTVAGATLASTVERVVAGLVDLALWAALAVLVVYFASRVAHVPMTGFGRGWPWLLAYGAFLGLVYAAWFTGTTGQTVGKIATGLRVVDEEGRPPGAARALLRAAVGVAGTLAFGAGLVPVLLDPQRRALHDRLAGTRVVRA